MIDLLEYVNKNLSSFDKKTFNEVDALVFSWISYYRLPNEMYRKNSNKEIALKDFYNAKYFDDLLFDIAEREKSKTLLSYIAASPRFRDITMSYYVEKTSKRIEKQFSAMTFRINNKKLVVAFRGTDHSFVGWKEDFNMSFLKHIPSQHEAVKYLEKILRNSKEKIYIVGHSKGGNLAVYAGSFLKKKYKKRIIQIYNFDGPNLNKDLTRSSEYKESKKLIKKYVPQSSVVGMCFDRTRDYKIIESTAIGVLQHVPFTWNIIKDKLRILKDTTFDSKMFKNGINALINNLSESELRQFSNTIYAIVEETKTNTVEELLSNLSKNLKIMFDASMNIDDSQRSLLSKVSNIFFNESFKNILKTK